MNVREPRATEYEIHLQNVYSGPGGNVVPLQVIDGIVHAGGFAGDKPVLLHIPIEDFYQYREVWE